MLYTMIYTGYIYPLPHVQLMKKHSYQAQIMRKVEVFSGMSDEAYMPFTNTWLLFCQISGLNSILPAMMRRLSVLLFTEISNQMC